MVFYSLFYTCIIHRLCSGRINNKENIRFKLVYFFCHISFPVYLLHELIIVSEFIFDKNNVLTLISMSAIFVAYICAIY